MKVDGCDWDWDLAEARVVVEEDDSSVSEPLCIKGAMLILWIIRVFHWD